MTSGHSAISVEGQRIFVFVKKGKSLTMRTKVKLARHFGTGSRLSMVLDSCDANSRRHVGTTRPWVTCLPHGIPTTALVGEASHGLILQRKEPTPEGGSLLTWGGAGYWGQTVLLQHGSPWRAKRRNRGRTP